MGRKGGGARKRGGGGARKGGSAAGRQATNNSAAQATTASSTAVVPTKVSQDLPLKEQGQWKNIVKYYELKQYKKALKLADQLLAKFPHHGETLAMKGLVLSCQDQKEEAHRCIKEGLRYNLGSHVCWHVYGIVNRTERNFMEAVSCFQQALQRNPDNEKMCSDLCTLLVHTGQYDAHAKLRREVLLKKSNQRNNWFAFAVALHLAGSHDESARAITNYLQSVAENGNERNYENSELLLFVNDTYEAKGDLKQAYEHLFQIESQVTDLFALRSKRVRLALQLGLKEDAIAQLRVLFRTNYENADILEKIWQALDIDPARPEDRPRIVEELAALRKAHPYSKLVARAPLFILPADHPLFVSTLHREIVAHLRKGATSLYGVLKPIYQDDAKVAAVESFLEQCFASVSKTPSGPLPGDETPARPDVLVWTICCLSLHHSLVHRYTKALELLDQGIAYAPTAIQLYSARATVLKRAGHVHAAAIYANWARRLDEADRGLNTTSTRYWLRADQRTQGMQIGSMFIKDGDLQDTAQTYLYDMQCLWYELELAESYYRAEDYAMALRKFQCIEKHFDQFSDDQWDFHSYYQRKVTLRAYVDMIAWGSALVSHPAYVQAMVGMARCYQRVAADPDRFLDLSMRTIDPSTLANAGERKRHQRELKKAQQRAAEELEVQKKSRAPRRVAHDLDEDPLGKELLHVDDHLAAAQARATRALQSVSKAAAAGSLTWKQQYAAFEAAFDIALQRGKFLLALQALNRAASVHTSSEDPLVYRMLCAFVGAVQKSGVDGVVRSVIDEELKKPSLLGAEDSIAEHSAKFVSTALENNDPLSLGAALQGAHLLDSATKDDITQSCVKALLAGLELETRISPQSYASILASTQSCLSEDQRTSLLSACAKRFPCTTAFNPNLPLPREEDAPDYI
mmetsp:Transcript_6190/g.18837  ORF Transcript_6190/g.18837 Transcript_6190/m.18837 type:complete len:916 (+) Transcript_6190:131-2878(+)|eukprot:CAMPEP_0174228952 /NCGR_PEP_ID=MMETSP0417-20130205/41_1 /TAXON_ID=242541 /ORGANISM="Mayorella sp, Strain BSH-02190019" /LENGTH=915 /DNA_ID=CAMNT_0015306443 /DNA_START=106 /DNA_END=2853 /DNA_ORIENTATION=+